MDSWESKSAKHIGNMFASGQCGYVATVATSKLDAVGIPIYSDGTTSDRTLMSYSLVNWMVWFVLWVVHVFTGSTDEVALLLIP